MSAIGDFLAEQRRAVNWTQTDVARRSGMLKWHQQTVDKVERGERPLRFHEAVILSSVLQFELRELAELVPLPEVCETCWGSPPEGFRCNSCGRSQ